MSQFYLRILTSLLFVPIIYFSYLYNYFFLALLSILFFLSLIEYNKLIFKIKKLKTKNLYIFFGIIYCVLSFFLIYLKLDEYKNLIFYFIIICIVTDIGGFIFGKTFKGKKLSYISPNKTYAGVYGSFLFSFLIMFLLKNYIDLKFIIILLFTFSVCLLSQFGDLFFSLLKRMAKVKDTGKLLPGHGGILDRIDGLIISVPFNILVYHISI